MSTTEIRPRFSRGRFIAAHFAAVLICAGLGRLEPSPIVLVSIAAPLAFLPGAKRPDVITILLSIVFAILMLALLFGIGALIFVLAWGRGGGGSWN